ncbi:MAG TPA: Fic family protein [Candidatus Paceibacterota bacterium]|nr:Fic family protein [Candidatus Paceibacterota bacterium]
MKNTVVELLHEKELLLKRLENLLYGSVEVRKQGEKEYIYLSYREQGLKHNKYAGVYSKELHNLILENNVLARQYKKRLREIEKALVSFDIEEGIISNEVKVNMDLAKRNLVDSIYKQARLEGVLATYADTETIISGGKVKNMKTSDVLKIVNLKRAWEFILNENVISTNTNYNILRQINGIVEDGFTYSAGQIRPIPVSITGTSYIPPIPIESIVIENINRIVNSNDTPINVSIELMLYVMKSQIFVDGNKRTAVIFANHFLINKGHGLIIVPEEALDEYRSHLIDYYEEKNNNIKRFLKEKCSFII